MSARARADVATRSSLALALAMLVPLACGAIAAPPDVVPGRDVRAVIDGRVAAQLRAQYPGLDIAPSVCPERMDVSGGKIATCRAQIDGTPVVFSVHDSSTGLTIGFGTPYFMRDVERTATREVSQRYGLAATVECGMPRVRTYAAGSEFGCSVVGFPGVTTLRFETRSNGRYQLFATADAPTSTASP